ncbi:TPA: hypothetical protein ACXNIY_003376, partial [Stenotrophomonas maltophilia]
VPDNDSGIIFRCGIAPSAQGTGIKLPTSGRYYLQIQATRGWIVPGKSGANQGWQLPMAG